jgi:glycosyltransferase involved in cell wall biosynthesis/GT2 family glycosyltransferase
VPLADALRQILRPRPIDWTRGAGRPVAERPDAVAVIIPIYGAAEDLRRCLAAVAAETDLQRHRVILVADGPQDEAVEDSIRAFAAAHPDAATVLGNGERRGFAGSVNRGIAATSSDVVLLNSDAIVTARWMEKLIDAAYSHGDVGTVTPLSNDATVCSIPRPFDENLIPSGFDLASFARLVESVSMRSYPRLPTGVGFCLYIRRALLSDIGALDAQTFANGYGEENDFCMRALARGWIHIADDATFVFHAGHRSFGPARHKAKRRGQALLTRRHRRYMATIAEVMRVDPLAPVRGRITGALPSPARGNGALRIVHLVHGWPPFQHGGTELYAAWLVEQQRGRHAVSVYGRAADPARADRDAVEILDRGTRVRLLTNLFTARNPLRRNAIRDRAVERDFERFLRQQQPDLLHVHHLAGHAFSLAHVARGLGIPIVMQIQDWWALCARVQLLDRHGNRCSGPSFSKCARCAPLTKLRPAGVMNRLMHAIRRTAARSALRTADAFIAGSNAIRADYTGVVPPATPFHVIPYGIALPAGHAPRGPAGRPVRFGFVGSIAPHKGVHTAVDAMRGIENATLHVWGDAGAFPEYVRSMQAGGNVTFAGRFAEDEKPGVFAAMDVLLVPSIGLESFCLTAREAMASGVPVIATSGAALSEAFEHGVCGEFFPPGDVAALRAILRRVAEDPSIVDRWAARLPEPKRAGEHAAEVERVYRSVLAPRA